MSEIIETRTLKFQVELLGSHEIRRLYSTLKNEINRLDGITDEEIERILADEKYKNMMLKRRSGKKTFEEVGLVKDLKSKQSITPFYEGHSNEIQRMEEYLTQKQVISIDFDLRFKPQFKYSHKFTSFQFGLKKRSSSPRSG